MRPLGPVVLALALTGCSGLPLAWVVPAQARAELAGVQHIAPHDFRRSCVSDLLEAGADLLAVSDLAGHVHTDTTRRYDRRGDAAKRKAVDRIFVPYSGGGGVNGNGSGGVA